MLLKANLGDLFYALLQSAVNQIVYYGLGENFVIYIMTKLVNKLCAKTVSCWFEMESVRIHLSCFAVTVHFHVKKSDCMGSCLLKCLKETNAASSVTLMEEIYQLDFSPVLFHGVQS